METKFHKSQFEDPNGGGEIEVGDRIGFNIGMDDVVTTHETCLTAFKDGTATQAMAQKTISLLWWASVHLSWADHVFKVGQVCDT